MNIKRIITDHLAALLLPIPTTSYYSKHTVCPNIFAVPYDCCISLTLKAVTETASSGQERCPARQDLELSVVPESICLLKRS